MTHKRLIQNRVIGHYGISEVEAHKQAEEESFQ